MSETNPDMPHVTTTPAASPAPPNLPHDDSRKLRAALHALPGPIDRATLFDDLPAWIVTDYEHVRAALTDKRLIKDPFGLPPGVHPFQGRPYPETGNWQGVRQLFGLDGADHLRVRRVLQPAFSAKALAGWRPALEANVCRLLEAVLARGGGDLVTELFEPVSTEALCHILDVPSGDRQVVLDGGRVLAGPLPPGNPYFLQVVRDTRDLATRLLRTHTTSPATQGGLLDLMVAATRDKTLSMREAVGNIMVLIATNLPNTVAVMARATVTLLARPDLASALAANPALAAPLTEEALRLASSTPLATWRFAKCPMNLAGTELQVGDIVLTALDSANHDPAAYEAPDQFRPGRDGPPHLAFGHGAHFCLGAELARMQIHAVLQALAPLAPRMRLTTPEDQLPWTAGSLLAGLAAVPVGTGAP
ncbi:cytochrome P450 [Longispora urticae]